MAGVVEGQGSGKLGQGSSQESEEAFPPATYIHNELPTSPSVPTLLFYLSSTLDSMYATAIFFDNEHEHGCLHSWVGLASHVSCLHICTTSSFFLRLGPGQIALAAVGNIGRICSSVCNASAYDILHSYSADVGS